jgi:hypothetical protein
VFEGRVAGAVTKKRSAKEKSCVTKSNLGVRNVGLVRLRASYRQQSIEISRNFSTRLSMRILLRFLCLIY